MKENVLGVTYLRRAALLFTGLLSTMASGQTLKKVAQFDLPGPLGKRFDYLTIDADDHYLISAHLAAGQTYVIDLATNKVVATIAETPGAEGVEYVPELKKFYTSNAGDNTIGVVDMKQMKVVNSVSTEQLGRWSLPTSLVYHRRFSRCETSQATVRSYRYRSCRRTVYPTFVGERIFPQLRKRDWPDLLLPPRPLLPLTSPRVFE